jgi:hypothetical protein
MRAPVQIEPKQKRRLFPKHRIIAFFSIRRSWHRQDWHAAFCGTRLVISSVAVVSVAIEELATENHQENEHAPLHCYSTGS